VTARANERRNIVRGDKGLVLGGEELLEVVRQKTQGASAEQSGAMLSRIARELEGLVSVGLQFVVLPDAGHRRMVDAEVAGHLPGTPVSLPARLALQGFLDDATMRAAKPARGLRPRPGAISQSVSGPPSRKRSRQSSAVCRLVPTVLAARAAGTPEAISKTSRQRLTTCCGVPWALDQSASLDWASAVSSSGVGLGMPTPPPRN
jgi:hypothetical protein